MKESDIKEVEIDLLIEALKKRYGYDFSSYARASLSRRFEQFREGFSFDSISAIIPDLMREPMLLKAIVYSISVPVTEMFRNPSVFRDLRESVLPVLRTYPRINIWNAGCATGQEVYSIAILLKELDLYDRSQIYATDFNDQALAKAKEGSYPINTIDNQAKNYIESGGQGAFSDYYHTESNRFIFDSALRENVVFANHNLISDVPFDEMHLILCRNVLIYFDQELQNRVLDLFLNSLVRGGYLCLGTHENIRLSPSNRFLEPVEGDKNIFKMYDPVL